MSDTGRASPLCAISDAEFERNILVPADVCLCLLVERITCIRCRICRLPETVDAPVPKIGEETNSSPGKSLGEELRSILREEERPNIDAGRGEFVLTHALVNWLVS